MVSRHSVNLTELELVAMSSGINVSDGHARQEPTPSQQRLIDRLGDVFAYASQHAPDDLDREAQRAFLGAVGQHAAINGESDLQILTCYSSSVAMEIFARAAAVGGVRRAAMIHPTFDNIPDILRGMGVELVPISESALLDASARLPDDVDLLFCTTPNNPTGRVLGSDALRHWARECAARGIVLALDTCFRGFDLAAQYDHYEVLQEAGCRYVVIEDTGKLWPTLDLKAGFLVFPATERLPLRRIHTDILLGISPVILRLVTELSRDAAVGGFGDLRDTVARNRAAVRAALAAVTQPPPDPDSRISVERVALPVGVTGTMTWKDLRHRGLHVLPCRQFHWAAPAEGERFVRVALGRPTAVVEAAADGMAGYFAERAWTQLLAVTLEPGHKVSEYENR